MLADRGELLRFTIFTHIFKMTPFNKWSHLIMIFFNKTISATAFALAGIAATIPASRAAVLTYDLNNAALSDGGQLTGSFSIDTTSQTITSWSINSAGGTLGSFSYTPASSSVYLYPFNPLPFVGQTSKQWLNTLAAYGEMLNFQINNISNFSSLAINISSSNYANLLAGAMQLPIIAGQTPISNGYYLISSEGVGTISTTRQISPSANLSLAVPGPVAGAGLPALLVLGGIAAARRSRRSRALTLG